MQEEIILSLWNNSVSMTRIFVLHANFEDNIEYYEFYFFIFIENKPRFCRATDLEFSILKPKIVHISIKILFARTQYS